MRAICTAVVNDAQQKKIICDCLKALGADVTTNEKTVCIEYVGNTAIVEKILAIFDKCEYHGICVMD